MQHDLFRSSHELSRPNCEHDLLRSNYNSFDTSQQEEHDAGNINVESNIIIIFFVKTVIFLEFLLSGGYSDDLRSNLSILSGKKC